MEKINEIQASRSPTCECHFGLRHLAEAQKPTQLPRIGFIVSAGPEAAPNVEPFRRGLRELGYIEGKNILIEYRYRGIPDQTPSLVAELGQLKVDVLVSGASPVIFAAKHETKSIPIVMVISRSRRDGARGSPGTSRRKYYGAHLIIS